jgi:iron complex transport system ATP-binding protein
MIEGLGIEIDAEAVVVRAAQPLIVLASAVAGGGLGAARAIVNVHVAQSFRCEDAERVLADFVRRRAVAAPWVGLLTAAWTEKAAQASDAGEGLATVAVATVGLSNPVGAGRCRAATWTPSTINTIVVVDASPEPAALVNLVVTVTEAKTLALAEAGVRAPDGGLASGTSSDAVVVAATGRGRRCRFGGPASELGAMVGRTVKSALEVGIRHWVREHP